LGPEKTTPDPLSPPEDQVSPGRGGPNDGWLTSTANSGSGPASLVRRLASISLRPALRIPERNNDLRRGPDLRSNEKSTDTDFFLFVNGGFDREHPLSLVF